MLDTRAYVNQVKFYHVQDKRHGLGGSAVLIYEQISTSWWYFFFIQNNIGSKLLSTWDIMYLSIEELYYNTRDFL